MSRLVDLSPTVPHAFTGLDKLTGVEAAPARAFARVGGGVG